MKKVIILISVFSIISLILPIIAQNNVKPTKNASIKVSATMKEKQNNNDKTEDRFRIKITKTGEITEIDASEYLFGCVAAEMPISYEEEALKAQCVAAYTYALRKRENSNLDYDISDDYKIDQCYLPRGEVKKKWGEKYEENRLKLEKIISETIGYKLMYENKTALTVYHAISASKTLSSKEVWGSDIPYLVSVDSSYDKLNEKYNSSVKVKTDELKKDFSIKEIKNIKTEKSKNGRVNYLVIGDKKINSADIVNKYSLRSSCFDAELKGEEICFSVYGYGHGVGMSQYGANCMAKTGSNFKEILNHYYKGTKLVKN